MAQWRRLADYFIVCGYQQDKDGESGSGKIIQRFPEKDWPDVPFTPGIELFCQPGGWDLTEKRLEPTFYVSALTDVDGNRHYCACLTFYEPYDTQHRPDDEISGDHELVNHSTMFGPKSIVLVSQLDYFSTFRHCLGIIYTVYVEGNYSCQIEELVGNILGCVTVPPAGGPQVRFTIGAGDRQAIQPPICSSIPTSRKTVAILFQELGIHNVLALVCAALTDHKILFISESYSRLGDASHALSTLLFPLKYSYVYIPLLPAALVEVLSTPTPFIAGIHSSSHDQIMDLLDVIVVNCDSGSVTIPECIHLPPMPEPMNGHLLQCLSLVINPDLSHADCAFPKDVARTADLDRLDKEIRAVFIRFFAELFAGYRACLQIVRIHTTPPVIQFHKAKFLGLRNLIECEFSRKVLESMCFSSFVQSRGAPFRICDVFDEVFATLPAAIQDERDNVPLLLQNIQSIANILYNNENANTQPYAEKIPRPTDGAFTRTYLPKFPIIDWLHVQEIIDKGHAKREAHQKHTQHLRGPGLRIVPAGAAIDNRPLNLASQARRLEVLHNCIKFIFENKISDARKIFPAVTRALKNKMARHAVTEDLRQHAAINKHTNLDHQQFLLIVKLLNALLQNESPMDENGIAAQILPLSDIFSRKLSHGVIQFAYTCIQDHAVWGNQQFWESTFYDDVQAQIKNYYQSIYRDKAKRQIADQAGVQPESSQVEPSLAMADVSCLEIAADELGKARYKDKEELKELCQSEEAIVYSQAIHYCNRMLYLKVPLDSAKGIPFFAHGEENSNSNLTPSVADSASVDAESGFEEQEVTTEVGVSVNKIIMRFIEKVCRDSGVTDDHMKNLNQMIPTVVQMHMDNIQNVCTESKRLPPILKPKITEPYLLPGEEFIINGLRAYLLVDGREEYLSSAPGPQLLPAEGALFLTTYRLIFKGTPCDQYACEQNVIRAFPVSALGKEKKLTGEYFQPMEMYLQHVMMLRSHTFQFLKVAFDEEVGEENVEHFRKSFYKQTNPTSVFETFAFSGASIIPVTTEVKSKERYKTLRDLGKTLKKTVRKAGLKSSKSPDHRQRYMLSGRDSLRGLPNSLQEEADSRPASVYGDEETWSMVSQDDVLLSLDPKVQERLSELLCYRDFVRLELISSQHAVGSRSRSDQFYLSNINAGYKMCRSYPGLLILPTTIPDESIMRLGRSHRQNRFPVITWRHPRTKALLLRASAFNNKSVMGKLKASQASNNLANRDSNGSLSTSLESEKYLNIISALTPTGGHSMAFGGSVMNTLSMTLTPTPEVLRTGQRAAQGESAKRVPASRLTMSHASTGLTVSASSSREKRNSVTSFTIGGKGDLFGSGPRSTTTLDNRSSALPSSISATSSAENELGQAALYVLCEKNQSKILKTDHLRKCEFVSVDYRDVASVKMSFKKFVRACVPGLPITDPERSFNKLVEDSGWLLQIQHIMQYAGACVDLLDVQGSSVMLALEDGWDITCQIVSVAQILLDPYYRTFEGFRTLIEKEWLSFGHRFSHRSHQTANNPVSSFAPIFLQFLDVVHQIHRQFPMSFEFNQFFLKFVAYHHLSNRFRTFMLDSECDRLESGWLLDERPKIGMAASEISTHLGNSIWDYVDLHSAKSSVFHNICYLSEETNDMVLRPHSNMANLVIWEYYIEENLAHGPPYDLELVTKETQLQASEMASEEDLAEQSGRLIVNQCYDNIFLIMPHSFASYLQEIAIIEKELNQFPSKWHDVIGRLEQPTRETLRRQYSLSTQYYRSHGRNVHKRSTIEFLVKGKMAPQTSKMFSQPHAFEKYHYNAPQSCDYCSHILWGFMKTGLKCSGCGYNCHEKCMSHVPKNCTSGRLRGMSDGHTGTSTVIDSRTVDATSPISDEDKMIYSASMVEHRNTFEGFLWKQGVLLKGWKQRWFVLDSMKHQLRYYDDKDDSHCRGFIDLAEVVSVSSTKPHPGAPKRADETAFFELRTAKRSYGYLAENSELAHKWIDAIQSRITQ